jgi:RNA polymerase sigma-70 factor (ECF subfamily)
MTAVAPSVTLAGEMTLPSRSDRRLLAGLRRGDPDAIRRLHAEHADAVFGFLHATLGERAAAEDVFQQVWLQAWQQAARYRPERGGLRAWLLMIARSRALDHLRKRVPEPTDPASGALALLEAEPAVDALLEQWRLAALLERLPGEERDLLRRRFYEGRTQREIAQDTGIALGTVKMRMVDGLARLRTMIEDEG